MRVAAIDCGTNSLRLLVAETTDPGLGGHHPVGPGSGVGVGLVDVVRRTEVVRLGAGVDATGAISPEAISRALALTGEYARICAELGVERVRFVATSASRDARNGNDFVAGVRAACAPYEPWGPDLTPEVLGGELEAALSYRGATAAVAGAGHPGDYLVVDLGGGSTEFARGAMGLDRAASLDVGSVRLTERHLRTDPPTPAEADAVRAELATALDEAEERVGFAQVGTLVGLAGSVTTITAHALALPTYEHSRVHLATLGVAQILAACADLAAMPRAARAALAYLHPGRVDVIVAGALAWAAIVERVRDRAGVQEVVASVHDILDGIVLELASE